MLRKIKRNWDVPTLAHYGVKGRLVVRFFILKDGTVDAERILASSGIPRTTTPRSRRSPAPAGSGRSPPTSARIAKG